MSLFLLSPIWYDWLLVYITQWHWQFLLYNQVSFERVKTLRAACTSFLSQKSRFATELVWLPKMSLTVPQSLKAADIARFAHRAGQLENARPAVAYWCQFVSPSAKEMLIFRTGNYWIVEQIIAKGLHQADDESKVYIMRLMDKLEQVGTVSLRLKSCYLHFG